jgi:hypothetical protein
MHYRFETKDCCGKRFYCFAIKVNSATAEEKYIKLTNGYPDIIARVPTHDCFLPWSNPETLSRVKTNYPS